MQCLTGASQSNATKFCENLIGPIPNSWLWSNWSIYTTYYRNILKYYPHWIYAPSEELPSLSNIGIQECRQIAVCNMVVTLTWTQYDILSMLADRDEPIALSWYLVAKEINVLEFGDLIQLKHFKVCFTFYPKIEELQRSVWTTGQAFGGQFMTMFKTDLWKPIISRIVYVFVKNTVCSIFTCELKYM